MIRKWMALEERTLDLETDSEEHHVTRDAEIEVHLQASECQGLLQPPEGAEGSCT